MLKIISKGHVVHVKDWTPIISARAQPPARPNDAHAERMQKALLTRSKK